MATSLQAALYPEPAMVKTRLDSDRDEDLPVASRATRRAAMDNAVSGMRTALVSLSWARNSLHRAATYGASPDEIAHITEMLELAEQYLEGAEATAVARLAYGEELPATLKSSPDGEDVS